MNRDSQIIPKLSNQSLIEVISKELPRLNKTQAKVAKTILADPKLATESSIATLAKKSAVSEPSVNRFCKRFNAKGFPDLKLRLARSLANGICYVNPKIDPSDKVASFTPKIFDTTISRLAKVRENISHQHINQIVESLVQARRIYFFAHGASAIVASDAANKFLRFNLPVSSHDDILIQQMLASKGRENDVFFIISETDSNKELIDIAQTAKKMDSTIISLTPTANSLSNLSNFCLFSDIFEFSENIISHTFKHVTLSSRIVHLVILDVLATGVALYIG
ncbi:MAG: SIS domain-containing protein [Porticoccaceae bacterium]|nr:SIS domain-containing protein [Porticoccaceae bacterium]